MMMKKTPVGADLILVQTKLKGATMKHPYSEYEKTDLWEIITKSIDDLIENQDIELTTSKEYVVGYICNMLTVKHAGILGTNEQ